MRRCLFAEMNAFWGQESWPMPVSFSPKNWLWKPCGQSNCNEVLGRSASYSLHYGVEVRTANVWQVVKHWSTEKDQLEWPTHAEVKLLVKTSFLRKGNLRGTRTKQPLDRWKADLGVRKPRWIPKGFLITWKNEFCPLEAPRSKRVQKGKHFVYIYKNTYILRRPLLQRSHKTFLRSTDSDSF